MPRKNKIIIRTGTGAPSASDFATGEPAFDSSAGSLYIKNAAGAMAQITGGSGGGGSSLVSYATTASFPATGTSNVFYLASDSSKIYRWESTVYVEVGAIATSISAADLTTGTLPDARLSSNIPTVQSLNKFFNFPTSGIDIFPRGELSNVTTPQTAGNPFYTFFTPVATVTVSAITMTVAANVGSGLTLARMGLYTFDETTAVLVARTASDTTLFTTVTTAYTRSFDTAGGYPASYTLVAGNRYGVAAFCAGTTLPGLIAKQINFSVGNLTPRIAAASTSASDLPASSTMGNSNTVIWARLT
jgi:hypothetical protein